MIFGQQTYGSVALGFPRILKSSWLEKPHFILVGLTATLNGVNRRSRSLPQLTTHAQALQKPADLEPRVHPLLVSSHCVTRGSTHFQLCYIEKSQNCFGSLHQQTHYLRFGRLGVKKWRSVSRLSLSKRT